MAKSNGNDKAAAAKGERKPNILMFGIDSLLATHLSCYGYPKQTSPHIDRFAEGGTLFENNFSPHIPTTPGYASMITGRDCFGTEVVALRHRGPLTDKIRTLPEMLRKVGYNTSCVGFTGNPGSRGYEKYLDYTAWGDKSEGFLPKAENLNKVAQPELDRLAAEDKPFFLFLRHMDPHSPYLPPPPYDRTFYYGNECDKKNKSMKPVMAFKPFCDYFAAWMPAGITDKDYVIAQYDGEIAYMDACIQKIFTQLETLGILDDTIVVINSDHGETLYDHDCYFDHHGIYDVTLRVPLIIRYPKKVPAGKRLSGYVTQKDLVPTLLELAEIKVKDKFDGASVMPMIRGEEASHASSFYITECTWMRKHGWRTPEWKLMVALEPDFHFKPGIELYNLLEDPHEDHNLAEEKPEIVKVLRAEMEAFIARREKEEGITNPMLTQGDWHGYEGVGPFKTSQQAYDTMHIGDPGAAQRLQSKGK